MKDPVLKEQPTIIRISMAEQSKKFRENYDRIFKKKKKEKKSNGKALSK